MNKKNFIEEVIKIQDKYEYDFYKEKIREKIKEMKLGEDYNIKCNIGNEKGLVFINVMRNKNHDTLEKAVHSMLFNNINWIFDIKSNNQIMINEYSLNNVYTYSPNRKITFYLEFLKEDKYKEFIELEEYFDENSYKLYSDSFLNEFLQNFSSIEIFIEYLKDKKEYQNIYKYFKERL